MTAYRRREVRTKPFPEELSPQAGRLLTIDKFQLLLDIRVLLLEILL